MFSKFRTTALLLIVFPLLIFGSEKNILRLTNSQREAHGQALLRWNSRLASAARHHAENMARYDQMAHELSDADLPALGDRLRYYDYRYGAAGENVAYRTDADVGAVLQIWMNSAGHRANILNRDFSEIGVGMAEGRQGKIFYCQVFATPR